MFIYTQLAFRCKDLSVNFVWKNVSDLIDHLLYLRMSPGTINQSNGVFPLKHTQLFLFLLMMFHESDICCKKANRFSTASWRLKYPILPWLRNSFQYLFNKFLLAKVRFCIRKLNLDLIMRFKKTFL